ISERKMLMPLRRVPSFENLVALFSKKAPPNFQNSAPCVAASTFFARLFVPLGCAEGTLARKRKEKHFFLLLFARLFVPLQSKLYN
ncbi:MAG: hypothetical protein IJ892_06285, partial [Prevotella sp.]|nr:hypothetical protein [Prevotella sp.]